MRTIRIMLAIAIASSFVSCYAQSSKKVEDKEFQTFLEKFRTIKPPLNYKKIKQRIFSMTKEEAIRFLHKTEDELYTIRTDFSYDTDEITGYYKEEHTAGCSFKYQLNDSLYILCTREWTEEDVGEPFGIIEVTRVYLNVFSMQGERLNKCIVGEQFTRDNDWVSFVLLDKTHICIFYYETTMI